MGLRWGLRFRGSVNGRFAIGIGEKRARRLGWDEALFLVMFNLLNHVVKDHT